MAQIPGMNMPRTGPPFGGGRSGPPSRGNFMGGAAPKKSAGMMPKPNMRGKAPAMMADGGFGAPAPIGGGAGAPPDPMAGGGADPDMDGDMDSPTIKPEAVNYHDEPHSCSACEYMGEGGQCSVLKMQVSPEGGCTAFETKGGGDEEMGEEMGGDMGDTDDMSGAPPMRGAPPMMRGR